MYHEDKYYILVEKEQHKHKATTKARITLCGAFILVTLGVVSCNFRLGLLHDDLRIRGFSSLVLASNSTEPGVFNLSGLAARLDPLNTNANFNLSKQTATFNPSGLAVDPDPLSLNDHFNSSSSLLSDREKNIYFAKLAEQAERYDEMAEYMKTVSSTGQVMSQEDRNLLSVAYKNAVGSRRASWRIISDLEQKEAPKGNDVNVAHCKEYRAKVESELEGICNTILDLLDDFLIPGAKDVESKVFYHKMKGDYYRYIAEFTHGDTKSKAADSARLAYEEAQDAARELPVTHPVRLGLALNFSVFHYEVLNNPDEACRMARIALEEGMKELKNVDEDLKTDSTLVMQLLQDNLKLWTGDKGIQ